MQEKERLRQIYNQVSDYLASGRDPTVSSQRLLQDVLELSDVPVVPEDEMIEIPETEEKNDELNDEPPLEFIVISCDASIKENPGGPASIGFVIRFPAEMGQPPIKQSRMVNAKSNNEAEYDAVYEGLKTLFNLHNSPKYAVIVRSDSKLVVNQLNGTWKINNESLKRRSQSIHEFCRAVQPVPVIIEWHRRNSTPDLTQANFMAQDVLGVPRH